MGKREEITDVISEEGYAKIKVGAILTFENATLRVTRKAKGRIWAEHVAKPVDMQTGMSHYGHNIDATQEAIEQYGTAYCEDCERPVSEEATEDGEFKALLRDQPTREARRKLQRAYDKSKAIEGEVVDDGPAE